jgi:aminopeptidase N
MRRVIVLLIVLAGLAVAVVLMREPSTEVDLAGPGIPLALADNRASRISRLTYRAALDVPAERTARINGSITAEFDLDDTREPLVFDFAQPADRLLQTQVNGTALTSADVRNGHIVIPADALTAGARNSVTFTFIAGDESLNRQDEFFYTLFVPARAHLAIPVFDQPGLKARWTLAVTIPAEWNAIANGAEVSRQEVGPGRVRVDFAETEPLPTYLVAVAAGRFQIEEAERNGRTFRMFHREPDAAKVARNRDAVFDLHASALAWLEEYTAIPYAFGKFDFVLIPSFQFGGMEHAGAVFYNASSLLLDPSATQNQYLGRASLIAHETAHMWFGDLVTMRWFNDVWMKEVFANFMAAKIVNPSFPEVNHDLRFLFSHYPAAYDVDRTEGANPIRQALDNLNDAGSLYGAIIYQKAPIVMRQLERLLGEDAFRDGLREYLQAHAMGNATWSDLIAILDGRTPADLVGWSRAWVEERGRPSIVVTPQSAAEGQVRIDVVASDPAGRGLVWPQALTMTLGSGSAAVSHDVTLADTGRATVSVMTGSLPNGARWVLPTGGGLGYGDFVLPADMLTRLAEDLPAITDPLTRGATVVLLWESMLDGRVAAPALLDTLLTAVAREQDELNLSRQLAYLQATFWRFLAPAERDARGPAVEAVLRAGLDAAEGTSRRNTWFGALTGVATTRSTLEWMTGVWRRDIRIPDLPLSEADETALASSLALRGIDVLDEQTARIANPDRRERFQFVRPALSSDAAVRQSFFDGFKDVEQRRREAWVLEAMGYIHHPLRAEASAPLVIPALNLVREIRDTGDIFFPKRWADAVLGGHQSPAVADDVRAFIAGLPEDYPQRLRWVLLASADPLFRAARQVADGPR